MGSCRQPLIRRVDTPIGYADDAASAGNGGTLRIGGRHRRDAWQRRFPLQRLSGAQLGAPPKRCAPHSRRPFKCRWSVALAVRREDQNLQSNAGFGFRSQS
jgi:hypothetical protein